MKFIQTQKKFAIYLFLLSVFGMVLVYLVTHRFGPGLSTDGSRYLSTAQNLITGKGLYDYLNIPLTQFPPLYSILIAGISLVTRLDVFVAGQYLNILTFGLVIWLAGYFLFRVFPDGPLFYYFGSAIFATSLSLIIMASNILSDLLFLAFTLAFLIAAQDMLEKGTLGSIIYLGVIGLSIHLPALCRVGSYHDRCCSRPLLVSQKPREGNYFCRVVRLFISSCPFSCGCGSITMCEPESFSASDCRLCI